MALLSVRKTTFLLVAAVFLITGAALAVNQVSSPQAAQKLDPPLVNWTAPATFSPHSASRGASPLADIGSGPLLFTPVTPCRQYDSRNFTPLPQNTSRAILLSGAPCGLPTGISAVSVNITIFNISGNSGNGVFQVGTATAPTFAWINFPQTETQRGNAGALPLDASHQLWVRVQMGAGQLDFTIDVNGYYPSTNGPINPNEFVGIVGSTGTSWCGELFVSNTSNATSDCLSAVNAQITAAPNGAAVIGTAFPTTAGANGVRGSTNSDASNSAGVLGLGGYAPIAHTWTTSGAGVRGEGRNGVVGTTSQRSGDVGEGGVIGVVTTSAGLLGPFGYLGAASGNYGVESIGNFLATGTKSFADPHPTDASKMIAYVSLEGRESGTYFRGTGYIFDGQAIIDIPEDFRMVTDPEGLTVQLTPVGAPASMYVVSENLNQIVVQSNRDVKFHYMVNGVRASFKDYQPIASSLGVFTPLSAESPMSTAFSPEQKRRLIANGTYNADGTVNLETARRLGWTSLWEHRSDGPAAPSVDNKP